MRGLGEQQERTGPGRRGQDRANAVVMAMFGQELAQLQATVDALAAQRHEDGGTEQLRGALGMVRAIESKLAALYPEDDATRGPE